MPPANSSKGATAKDGPDNSSDLDSTDEDREEDLGTTDDDDGTSDDDWDDVVDRNEDVAANPNEEPEEDVAAKAKPSKKSAKLGKPAKLSPRKGTPPKPSPQKNAPQKNVGGTAPRKALSLGKSKAKKLPKDLPKVVVENTDEDTGKNPDVSNAPKAPRAKKFVLFEQNPLIDGQRMGLSKKREIELFMSHLKMEMTKVAQRLNSMLMKQKHGKQIPGHAAYNGNDTQVVSTGVLSELISDTEKMIGHHAVDQLYYAASQAEEAGYEVSVNITGRTKRPRAD